MEIKRLELETKLRLKQNELKGSKERLFKDFNNEINWVLRAIYDANQWIEILTFILKDVDGNDNDYDMIEVLIKQFVDRYETDLFRAWNVRKRSTCEVTNMTSTWEFENKIEILNFLKQL